jgi:hypothetical protein
LHLQNTVIPKPPYPDVAAIRPEKRSDDLERIFNPLLHRQGFHEFHPPGVN